jgi:hypothetical protein
MKIVSRSFEMLRATPAVAEFLVHIELDGTVAAINVAGRAVGPQCPGVSTVEVAYPMTVEVVSGTVATLRCVIPEPNLWTSESQITYAVTIEVRSGGEIVATQCDRVALRMVRNS